ncbi:MAG: HDOD domain-containing protein [bacterium]
MQKISRNELIVKIKEDIPTLPIIVTRILNIVLDDKSSVKDLTEVVRVDQALVSKVLRVVNSAAYALREKVSTVDHAMTILGYDALKKLFLCFSVFDNLAQENKAGYLFPKSQFWCHSLAVATVAKSIASLIKYPNPDEAYVAGLLHDVGKIIIEQIMVDEYLAYMKNLNMNPDMSLHFEEENLSVNHAEVGKLAFEKWNLPPALQKAVELHHGPEKGHVDIHELAAIVSVADFICWTQALGSFNFFFHPTLNPEVEKIVNLNTLKIEPILDEMNREVALNAKIFNLQINDLKGFREALQKANLELGRINSLYDDTRKRLEKHIHELNTLNTITYKARETLKPSEIIQNALQGVKEGLGFPRLIWFSVDPQKKMIIPQASCGEFPDNTPLTTLGLSWDDEIGALLSTSIRDKKILHLKNGQSESVPEINFLKALQSSNTLLVPIRTDQKVNDLLLIDNHDNSVAISSDTIKVIEILALNLGMALENAKLFQCTAQMAVIDSLTEVYNRRQLDSSLSNEVNRSARFQQIFSIALFDIDHFKEVNDTYGHPVGDLVLKDVSAIIKSNSRNIDIVGRLGGDEFLVILPNTEIQGALTFAERVRVIVERYGLLRQKNFPKCQITLSIGLASFNNAMDTPERLLNKADKALYQSKQKRNKVTVYRE